MVAIHRSEFLRIPQNRELTEAGVADSKIPPVDAKVVRTHERLTVRVHSQGVDVVRVCVRIDALRRGVQRRGADCIGTLLAGARTGLVSLRRLRARRKFDRSVLFVAGGHTEVRGLPSVANFPEFYSFICSLI